MKQLLGHTSQETAFLVNDYPYGFRLRCKIRYWIETTKNGQRFCSQTTDPRKSIEVWNKPRKSTYNRFSIIVQNDDAASEEFGHVHHFGLSHYEGLEKVAAFMNKWTIEGYAQEVINAFKAKVDAKMTATVPQATN